MGCGRCLRKCASRIANRRTNASGIYSGVRSGLFWMLRRLGGITACLVQTGSGRRHESKRPLKKLNMLLWQCVVPWSAYYGLSMVLVHYIHCVATQPRIWDCNGYDRNCDSAMAFRRTWDETAGKRLVVQRIRIQKLRTDDGDVLNQRLVTRA